MTKLILISGKARHGKDSVAKIIKTQLEADGKRVLIARFADLVKYVCKTFLDWNGEKDETGRTLLQYVGTDTIRAQDPDYWVRFIGDMIRFFNGRWDYILVRDARFENEIEYFKNNDNFSDFEVISLRVQRTNFVTDLTPEQMRHPSETALDSYEFDYSISAKKIPELEKKVRKWLKVLTEVSTEAGIEEGIEEGSDEG